MSVSVKDLCRLCARKEEVNKDLLDSNNQLCLRLIQELLQVVVLENDQLPTKLCLICEDKLLQFHLFILDSTRVQDLLKKLSEVQFDSGLPDKEQDKDFKLEIKEEHNPDDLLSGIVVEEDFSGLDINYSNDEELFDDMTIASLKKLKKSKVKRVKENHKIKKKHGSKRDCNTSSNITDILAQGDVKIRNLVSIECHLCKEEVKNWDKLEKHYEGAHAEVSPVLYCVCGYMILSKSSLYKHTSEHKQESNRLRGITDTSPNVDDLVKFQCNVCPKQCSSWYTLSAHSARAHRSSPVVACACGAVLKSRTMLYRHVASHKNPNLYRCDICPRITKSLTALAKHKEKHNPSNSTEFRCQSCEKVFHSKDLLKSHLKSHIPLEERKVHECEICHIKFTTRSSALSHKRVVHDNIRAYICDVCGYSCGTNGELKQHRAIHSDDKPFTCATCSKGFKTYSNLKTHMDTHEDTSYECYLCRRVLNSRRTLKKHLLVHESECRHVCSYCNKSFKRRQTLKVHLAIHTGDKPLSCKWCDERFAYASTLRSHRLRFHPDKMAARAQNIAARAHQATHTYVSYTHITTGDNQENMKSYMNENVIMSKPEAADVGIGV